MDVRKTVTDSGYIALGLAVMGAEQASSTAQQLSDRTVDAADPARTRLAEARTELRTKISSTLEDTRARLSDEASLRSSDVKRLAQDVLARSDELVVRAREQLAPLVERLPEPARKANASWNELVDNSRARVRELVEVPAAA